MCHRFDEAKLSFADRDEVALLELATVDSHGVDEHTVAAAEIFDQCRVAAQREASVLSTIARAASREKQSVSTR